MTQATLAPFPIASSSVGFSAQRLDKLSAAMRREVGAGHYAGISVAVARHEKLAMSCDVGY